MKKSRIVRPAAGVESPPPRRLPLVRLAQAAMVHRDTSVSALCRELGITPVAAPGQGAINGPTPHAASR